MKRYINYISSIEPPAGLASRLEELRPAKRPFPLRRAAALAAAFALAIGIGAFASLGGGGETELAPGSGLTPAPTGETAPTQPPAGSYQMSDGTGAEDAVYPVTYPTLDFADGTGLLLTASDYALGPGTEYDRDLTEADIESILSPRFRDHLGLPGDAQISGRLYFTPDAQPCAARILVTAPDLTLTLELLRGGSVPDCIVPPDGGGITDYQGCEITAVLTGESSCQVSFLLDGTGWKAEITSGNYADLASRLVRLAVSGAAPGLPPAASGTASHTPGDTPRVTPPPDTFTASQAPGE